MTAQIWGAHPSNRTEYMILDWLNWDNMPEPIISTDVIAAPERVSKVPRDALPWDI